MTGSLLLLAAAAVTLPPLPAFLAGCWDQKVGNRLTQECWMEPRGGMMLGASRDLRDDVLRSWETLRIERAADGTITLFASPGGRSAVPFAATSVTASAIEFANPAHDYPQRIRYELKGKSLEAETSLLDGSKANRWVYVREGN